MSKTLVIILSETRASELTFDNFKKNVIDELNADLCVCIGVKPDYNYDDPYYKLANYKFVYNEPEDYGDAFEYAYNIISLNKPKYEKLENINSLYGKIQKPLQSNDNITYHGTNETNILNFENFNDDEIVIHTNDFQEKLWKNQVYGIKNSDNNNFINQTNVITYKKHLYWREFLKIQNQFLGGIKDKYNQHPGSAGILIFFRWFLLKNLIDNDLINKYDKFIITRSDFIYQLPHPKVELMNEKCMWIPDCEQYGGYTDRHVILSKNNIEPYLNILNNFVLKSNDYFIKMKNYHEWNLEKLIKFNLDQQNSSVKLFPYIMYSIRNKNGTTRWSVGQYSNKLGYFIKYQSEYDKSSLYKSNFEKSKLSIYEFYKDIYSKKYKIPNIIMQTNKYKSADYIREKIMQKSINFEYIFFDDNDCINYFKNNYLEKYHDIINKFNSIKLGAHKADLFRYYFLYINGGIFIDSDAMIEINIELIIKNYDFFSCESINCPGCIFQGFIGATKNNQIILRALDDAYNIDIDKLDNDYLLICRNLNNIIYNYTYKYDIKIYKEQYNNNDSFKVVDDYNNTLLVHYNKYKIIPI